MAMRSGISAVRNCLNKFRTALSNSCGGQDRARYFRRKNRNRSERTSRHLVGNLRRRTNGRLRLLTRNSLLTAGALLTNGMPGVLVARRNLPKKVMTILKRHNLRRKRKKSKYGWRRSLNKSRRRWRRWKMRTSLFLHT